MNLKKTAKIKISKFIKRAYIIFSNILTKKGKERFCKFKKRYKKLYVTCGQAVAVKQKLRVQYDEIHEKLAIIEKSQERYKLSLDSTNDAMWEIDLITKMFSSSNRFNDITGYDKEVANSIENIIKLVLEEDREIVINDFIDLINGRILYYQCRLKLNFNGIDNRWFLIRSMCLRDTRGVAIKIVGSILGIAIQRNFEEEINKLKYYDILTDTPNRKLFISTLENEIIKSKGTYKQIKHAILFIDLDNFKEVNDTLGHTYGDELLINVANLIKATMAEGDLVSRVGGDEFFILMKNIKDYSKISRLCIKLQSLLNCAIRIDDKHVYTSASIGIAIFPNDGYDTNVLLKNADTAMYSAKNNGKARYSFFNESMSSIIVRRAEIEKGLRNALENNEFEMYYQPQIDIINNKLKGFEALLRWNSAKLGKVSPAEFIPIAEQSGLIVSIGEWIIKMVCLQNSLWKSKGYLYDTIAINLSGIQLQNDDFEETLKHIINETKINPKFVELEITESIFMKDFERSIKLLTAIRELGITIALDDFGTGYSSLSYLKRLPINTLKIDKSFIDNIDTNEREKVIVDGIILLAQKIGLDVIAEGAETKNQIELLKGMGCNQIQGYYFSRPLSACEIEEKFLNTNCINC
ncbi:MULTISPECIES: putative bifunctional diguanylate cyclase/phosphodiesterase [Clostridium]|uniref:EAL domain-containing protein n=1 Tax=Clostridium frigoriphilum TaxID=443253 RepID=A0ABU7UJL0_9CLOT|nr:EAL domain-containing protein [Clostridium sp. DSM 17811]